jgi:hypothetical protein
MTDIQTCEVDTKTAAIAMAPLILLAIDLEGMECTTLNETIFVGGKYERGGQLKVKIRILFLWR